MERATTPNPRLADWCVYGPRQKIYHKDFDFEGKKWWKGWKRNKVGWAEQVGMKPCKNCYGNN